MAAKKRRHELALRIDDLMLLREAARVGRATMIRTLRQQKAEMQQRIRSVEILDDVLGRLDVQIIKASDALGFELPPESQTEEWKQEILLTTTTPHQRAEGDAT